MSVRRPRGHRRVGDDGSSILLQGSQSQLRVGVSDPPMRLRGEANVDGVPPEPTGGSGTCRTGPEHVAPITGYGAKAPVGFPCWMSRSTPALPYREGTADPGRVMTRIAAAMRHWTNPRRCTTRPAPSLEGQSYNITDGACRSDGERLSRRVHLDAPRHCPGASRCTLHRAASPHPEGSQARFWYRGTPSCDRLEGWKGVLSAGAYEAERLS